MNLQAIGFVVQLLVRLNALQVAGITTLLDVVVKDIDALLFGLLSVLRDGDVLGTISQILHASSNGFLADIDGPVDIIVIILVTVVDLILDYLN